MTDDDLDGLFAEARADSPAPSPALMARILADAAAVQPRPAAAPPRRAVPRFGLGAVLAALGGFGSLAGLASAAVAGLWIGLAPPAAVDDLAASLWPVDDVGDSIELFPDLEGMIDDADG